MWAAVTSTESCSIPAAKTCCTHVPTWAAPITGSARRTGTCSTSSRWPPIRSIPTGSTLATGAFTNDWAGNATILRSTVQGRTFIRTELPFKLGSNEDGRGTGERLAVHPGDHGTLLLGTGKSGLWRSTDYGMAWSQVGSFPVKDGVGIGFVTFDPADSRTIYVGVEGKSTSLYRSTNGGSTWKAIAGQLP